MVLERVRGERWWWGWMVVEAGRKLEAPPCPPYRPTLLAHTNVHTENAHTRKHGSIIVEGFLSE